MPRPADREYLLAKAYVPEHIPELMAGVSGGRPLIEDCFLYCLKPGGWAVLTGYPLEGAPSTARLAEVIETMRKNHRLRRLSLIAPRLPADLPGHCADEDADRYYVIDPDRPLPARWERKAVEADSVLRVGIGDRMTADHEEVCADFLDRTRPGERVSNLLARLPDYVASARDALVIDARTLQGGLAAFYLVDLSARNFAAYLIGAYSRRNYVPGASDRLMLETVRLARRAGRGTLHLGLGVNRGVRQFKKKWGGRPEIPYAACEISFGRPKLLEVLAALGRA